MTTTTERAQARSDAPEAHPDVGEAEHAPERTYGTQNGIQSAPVARGPLAPR